MRQNWKLPAAISASLHLLLALAALLIPLSPAPLAPPLPAVVEIVAASVFEPPQLISQGDEAPLAVDDSAAAAGEAAEPAPEPEPAPQIAPAPEASQLPPLLAGNSDQPALAPLIKASGSGEVKPTAGYQAGSPGGGSGEAAAAGGGSGSGGSAARVTRGGKPSYPLAARKAGWEGAVIVGILVDERGRAATVTVRESSGYAALDNAAVEGVKKWRFAPAKRNGEAVASLHVVRVKFNLTDPD